MTLSPPSPLPHLHCPPRFPPRRKPASLPPAGAGSPPERAGSAILPGLLIPYAAEVELPTHLAHRSAGFLPGQSTPSPLPPRIPSLHHHHYSIFLFPATARRPRGVSSLLPPQPCPACSDSGGPKVRTEPSPREPGKPVLSRIHPQLHLPAPSPPVGGAPMSSPSPLPLSSVLRLNPLLIPHPSPSNPSPVSATTSYHHPCTSVP